MIRKSAGRFKKDQKKLSSKPSTAKRTTATKSSPKFDLGVRCEWAVPMVNGHASVEENFFLGVRDGLIVEARKFRSSDKSNSSKFIDRPGMAMIPGLINGHTHLPMTLFRGIEDDSELKVWLFDRILPLEAKFVTPEFCKLGTELAALECIRFGTTTVNEMYFFAEIGLEVWDQAGLRGIFSQGFFEGEMPEDKILGPDRFTRFQKLFDQYKSHPRLSMALAPHAPYSCGDDLLQDVALVANNNQARIHIHLSESAAEVEASLVKNRMRPTYRLHKLGILGSRTACAHSVHIDDDEIKLLKETGTNVLYNPDSNAKLASGVAPIPKYFAAGIPVSLGTDGSASCNDLSLFGAMDLGVKTQKLFNKSPTAMTAEQILQTTTWMGARALGMEDRIGSLEVGKRADFAIVDFNLPHMQPVNDIVSHLVYAAQGLEVDTVVCEGRVLLQDKKFKTMDPLPVYKRADKIRKQIQSYLKYRKV